MSSSFDEIIEALPALTAFHARSAPVYRFLAAAAREQAALKFGPTGGPQQWKPFGAVTLPYHRMGAIDSVDLFGLDELILFAFYWSSRNRYKKVLDLGANLGLHSIVLNRCGYEVQCYEPDPVHYRILTKNLALNDCARVTAVNAAVSSQDGEAEFVRVVGNTTSSHLAGSKDNPYGELERFKVKVAAMRPLMAWADLIKMDVEGHERQIICSTGPQDWQSKDMMLEVGAPENAKQIFDHCAKLGLSMFAQLSGWSRVTTQSEMPTSYKDGSLFITRGNSSPWA